jgi:hypothetical protein
MPACSTTGFERRAIPDVVSLLGHPGCPREGRPDRRRHDGLYAFTNLELALRRRKPWLASPR